MKYRYFWLICLLFSNRVCFAQYTYQQLDNSYGLSNSCINTIYRDADNLVWFGTWDGLNFYDGSNIHVFNYERTDLKRNSIASNVIYQLEGDKQRNIWIGTVEGVSRFNKNTGDFSNYFYSTQKAVSNGYTIAINGRGEVYAARRNSSQLFVYNNSADQFLPVTIQNLPHFMLLKIFFDGSDNLWLLKDDGKLESFRKRGRSFVKLDGYAPADNIDNVFYCNHQVFFQTKADVLFRVTADLKKEQIGALPHEVRDMNFFNGHYVFAWSSKGIGEYDTGFKPLNLLGRDMAVLQNGRITSLVTDNNDLLWAGTDGNGVMKIARKETQFGMVRQLANGQDFHIPVRAFCEVNGELWIGTKGNGIITLKNWDKNNRSFSDIENFHTGVDLLDNCVYAISKSPDGLVYIGSDAQGVTLYDTAKRHFIKWGQIASSARYPAFGSVHCILNDRDGSVWLGLNEGGLVHTRLQRDTAGLIKITAFSQYKYDGSANQPGNNVIYSLAEGNDDVIWIGCRYGGLSMFDKKAGRFRTMKAFSYEGSLSNNDVLSLFIDRENRLWAGTSFGLNWTDETVAAHSPRPVFRKLFVDDGLPNNTIHALSEDEAHNIWLSTNKGLAKVNPQTLSVIQYRESDGLQSDEFSDNAVWKNPAGTMFFGGIYGFNYFEPAAVHFNREQPDVLINNLQLAGKTSPEKGLNVLTKNGAVSSQHFDLQPGDNYFELNLQPVTYTHVQKCQFASMLKGDDKAWHYLGNQTRIVYNNIPPGNYTLLVKWSNGEGAWTSGVAAFSLTVHQYFWLTLPAFLIYAVILLAGAYTWLRYKKNRFILAQELKMEHMLREKDEALHQQQLNFFTNIAHELQTPLTLILGSLERYLYKSKPTEKPGSVNFLSIVKQEASRLQYLVQQLLEFRKAEAGKLKNHYEHFNVSALLDDIAHLFTALVDEKRLDFSWNIERDIAIVNDKDKLEKIVFNLLSNAFRYTNEGGYIIFSVNKIADHDQLELLIANSGCDLRDDEAARIFDKFFTLDGKQNKRGGTGIGLAFTRQLVQLLDGDISVSCAGGWITFKVLLPVAPANERPSPGQGLVKKEEKASYLVSAMTQGRKSLELMADNNKKSLMSSLEERDRRSILVVEDDQLIRLLLRDILLEQYVVYESATGLEALELMKRVIPSLIISDIMMPDMDGLELCRIIKNTTETCHVPFVLLSARTAMEHKTEGYGCGADAYIAKPFQTEHLLVRIQKLLEYREKLHDAFRLNTLSYPAAEAGQLNETDRHFIDKVTRIIEENLDEDLDSAFLEQALNMSKIQVYRKIKTLSDMTPTELIRHVRLQKAAALLLNTDLTVSEVFYRTGFNNKTYFYREFKKIYNCPPNDYRAHHRLPQMK